MTNWNWFNVGGAMMVLPGILWAAADLNLGWAAVGFQIIGLLIMWKHINIFK